MHANPTTSRAWYVSGRVQGVGFRYATRRQLSALSLEGEASNLADGRVHVRARGQAAALDKLERWLWIGPPTARVEKVTLLVQ